MFLSPELIAGSPGPIWPHALADLVVGASCMAIPPSLAVLVRRRADLAPGAALPLLAGLIVLLGSGHLVSLLPLRAPVPGLEGLLKAATAVVAAMTLAALWRRLPRARLLPSATQLRQAGEALAEREGLRAELWRLNNDLQQFAHIASHDLKAPLHAISCLAEWVAEDVQGSASPQAMENLALLQKRAHRLEMLIAGLRSYVRVGQRPAQAQAVELAALVEEVARAAALPPGFTVRFSGPEYTLLTERAPLQHVLGHLMTNAIRHHDRDQGTVTVSARWAGGVAEVSVADDGPGIPPEYHARIFRIFETLHSRDDRETSGIGLSIVKKTVERAGGRVRVESEPPLRGSVFRFTWPAATVVTSRFPP